MRLLLTTFTSILLLVGCSATPSKPSTNNNADAISPAGHAVYDILEADTRLRYWVNACQSQSDELNVLAKKTYESWWQRNDRYVEAADFGLAYGITRVTDGRVETGARMAMGITWNIVKAAELDLAKHFVSGKAEKACTEVLTQYANGEFDLYKKQPNQGYDDLKRFQDTKQKELSLANKSANDYGRSYYVVEKLLQQENCVTSDINLVKNDWPHELYEANCPGKVYKLLQCEWGSCRTLR